MFQEPIHKEYYMKNGEIESLSNHMDFFIKHYDELDEEYFEELGNIY